MSRFDSLKERDLVWFDRGLLKFEFHRVFDKDGQEWVEGFVGNSAYRIPSQFVQTEKPVVLNLTRSEANLIVGGLGSYAEEYDRPDLDVVVDKIREKLND